MKSLVWSPAFIRAFKHLVRKNPQIRTEIDQVLQQLVENPFHPSLYAHKLKGDLSDIWSCSVDYSSRILFKFVRNPDLDVEEILLLTCY